MPRRLPVLRPALFTMLLLSACHAGATQPDTASYPNTEGFGVPFEKSEDWYRHCARVQRLAPQPPPPPGKMRCDATDLYYQKRDGASISAAEWRQVRTCAEANDDDAVLMMLHANGYGTARDPDRALYHACRLTSAKAEMEGRVTYLATRPAVDGQPFDLCDHVTSGRMGAVCAALGEGRDARTRNARLERFAADLPNKARPSFARLRQAAAAFARTSAGEVDRSGTGGTGFALRHTGRREEEFLETLLEAAGGKLPRAGARDLARLDRQLNVEYRQVMTAPSKQEHRPQRIGYSTVEREDVRSSERAWLAYRDAWAPFISAAGLRTDFTSVQAALTRQRIAQLKRI